MYTYTFIGVFIIILLVLSIYLSMSSSPKQETISQQTSKQTSAQKEPQESPTQTSKPTSPQQESKEESPVFKIPPAYQEPDPAPPSPFSREITIPKEIIGNTVPAAALVWTKTSESESVGGSGGFPGKLFCDRGHVTEVYGSIYANHLESVGIKCSDDTDKGKLGGTSGEPFSIKNPRGFDKLQVKGSNLVDNVKFFGDKSELLSVGESGITQPVDLTCDGGKIMGLNVRTGSLVDNIQVVCGKLMQV